ncbi:MAG TPA: SAM-dependent methyltransferase [Oceanospirillaceae bacterium]|nr:SAM-dependent methyltransferase [Oceanospirillaceae bacterium]
MSEKFWDKIANKYSQQKVADPGAYEKKLSITQQYFTPESNVLEFACGTGSTAIIHAPFVRSILATDISSNMIEIAKEKLRSNNIDNIQFKKCSIEEIDVADESLDVVMAHSILHLVNNPDDVIRIAHSKLKQNGFFVTSTVCMGDSFFYSVMARLISLASILGVLPRLQVLSSKGLARRMEELGFEIDYQWRPTKNGSIFIIAKKV